MGLDLPPGLALKHKIEGTTLSLDLLYDPGEWGSKFNESPPQVRLSEDGAGGYEVMWQRIAPGHFNLTHELSEGSVVRGSAIVGSFTLPFGPFNIGSSAEWAFDRKRVEELRHLSSATGGRELLDLQKAWVMPDQLRVADIRVWSAAAILMLLLLDAVITRAGWPLWTRGGSEGSESMIALKKGKKAKPIVEVNEKDTGELPESSAESRRARLERAKRKR